MINVLFFGPVAEQIGQREVQINFQPGLCLHDVIMQFQTNHPKVFELVSCMAVNQTQTRDLQLPLADNDTIALMAKFSGG